MAARQLPTASKAARRVPSMSRPGPRWPGRADRASRPEVAGSGDQGLPAASAQLVALASPALASPWHRYGAASGRLRAAKIAGTCPAPPTGRHRRRLEDRLLRPWRHVDSMASGRSFGRQEISTRPPWHLMPGPAARSGSATQDGQHALQIDAVLRMQLRRCAEPVGQPCHPRSRAALQLVQRDAQGSLSP